MSWPSTSTTPQPNARHRRPSGSRLTVSLGRVALLQAVAVDDDGQVVEAELRGRHAASQLLPSCSSPSPVSTNVRQVGAVHLRGERHADGDRQAVAERPGVGLDARHLAIRMAVEHRQRLHVGGELLAREEAGARRASRRGRPTRDPCSGRSGRGPGRAGAPDQAGARERRAWRGYRRREVAARMAHARRVHHPQAGAPDAPARAATRFTPGIFMQAFVFMRHGGNLSAARRLVNGGGFRCDGTRIADSVLTGTRTTRIGITGRGSRGSQSADLRERSDDLARPATHGIVIREIRVP